MLDALEPHEPGLARWLVADDAQTSTPHPFNVKTVEHLIGLMAEHDLSEIALKDGEQVIRLRRGGSYVAPQPQPQAMPAAPSAGASSPPAATATPTPKYHEITSEMVGTCYLKPKPDQPEFIKVGATIRPDSTLCLIEAMKIFNEIKADISGTLMEVCVKNGDPVDFGTVLFRVDLGH